jgi:ferredoxin
MGSAQCCFYAPNTFDQDEETIAVAADQHGDPEEAISTAIASCPARAISRVERSADSEFEAGEST